MKNVTIVLHFIDILFGYLEIIVYFYALYHIQVDLSPDEASTRMRVYASVYASVCWLKTVTVTMTIGVYEAGDWGCALPPPPPLIALKVSKWPFSGKKQVNLQLKPLALDKIFGREISSPPPSSPNGTSPVRLYEPLTKTDDFVQQAKMTKASYIKVTA